MNKTQAIEADMWIAAIQYQQMLETTWKATVVVTIQTDGVNIAQTVHITVRAVVPTFSAPGRCVRVEKTKRWPNSEHATPAATVYALCHELDTHIGQELHQQQELPF